MEDATVSAKTLYQRMVQESLQYPSTMDAVIDHLCMAHEYLLEGVGMAGEYDLLNQLDKMIERLKIRTAPIICTKVSNEDFAALLSGDKKHIIMSTVEHTFKVGTAVKIKSEDEIGGVELVVLITHIEPASPLVTSKIASVKTVITTLDGDRL